MQHTLKTLFIVLGYILVACPLSAQSLSFEKPVEVKNIKADEGTVKLIILSTSANLSLTHEMGKEQAQRFDEGENQYRYELVHALSEDEIDYGGFCKTTVSLVLPEGSQKFPMTLYAGKCYRGRFQPAGITCLQNSGGVYPQAGKAKVTFSSALADLSIWCNGYPVFDKGKLLSAAGSSVKAEKGYQNNLHQYEFEFAVPSSEAAVQPSFRVKSTASGILDVQVDAPLEARKSYNFSVAASVKTVKRAYTFDETKAIADKYLTEYASQSVSSYFEAASNAIDEVLAHKDCPLDIRDSLLLKQNELKYIRKYSLFVEKAQEKKEESEKANGYNHATTYKWIGAERKFCNNIVKAHPEMTYYQKMLTKIDDELARHPQAQIAVQTTVRHEYQVITGKVTKDETFIGDVAGVAIYGTYMPDGSMGKTDKMTLLGKVSSNGTYRIVLKNPHSYLYFYGERVSRPITSDTETLDVELTRDK